LGGGVGVVLGVLEQLKDEAGFACVEVLGQARERQAEVSWAELEVRKICTYVRTEDPIFWSLASIAASTLIRDSGGMLANVASSKNPLFLRMLSMSR